MNYIKTEWSHCTRYICMAGAMTGVVIVDVMKNDDAERVGVMKGHALIWNLFVHEDMRKQGKARSLLNYALRICKKEGVKKAWLEWNEADTPRWVRDWYCRLEWSAETFNKHYALMCRNL